MTTLFIITGRRRLEKSFFEILCRNNQIMYSNNDHVYIEIDLSKTTKQDSLSVAKYIIVKYT